MKNVTVHKGILKVLGRLPSSVNGNPRFRLSIGGFECRTAPDSAHAYKVQNDDGKMVKGDIGTYYGCATLGGYKVMK